jgi:putative ABC transport system permease protein
MSLLIKMGLKNIRRNRLRSILTIAAVVLCAGGVTIYSVIFSGVMDMFVDGMALQTGHVRLIHPKLAEKERLGEGLYFVRDVDKLVAQVKEVEGVRAVVPRINLGAFIDYKGKQSPARGVGIDPQEERKVWKLHEKLVSGRMLRSKGKEVLLGYRLAERIEAKVGSSIVLVGKTYDDSMSAIRVKVVGLLKTGVAMHDKMFFVNIPTAQYFVDIEGQASAVLVFASALWKANGVAKRIKELSLPPQVTAQSWTETPLMAYMLPMANAMLFILGGIVVFIGGIGLLNTMTMSVLERRGEVGIMMALGLPPWRVAGVFLTEGLVFGVIGAVVGVGIAVLGSIPLITTGLTFQGDATAKFPVPLSATIKGTLTIEGILIGLFVGVLATVVGSIWPTIKASRMDPVDALRK